MTTSQAGPATGAGAAPDAGRGTLSPVAALVARLDGLERRPLSRQAEVLDAVRRGLDEELACPVADG